MIKSLTYVICFAIAMISINYCKTHRDPVSDDAQYYMPEITKGVNAILGGPMCIIAGPFPIAITPQTRSISGCLSCERLFKTGMIEKSYPHNYNDPNDHIIQLSSLGVNYYTESVSGRDPNNEMSGFCFGDAKLNKVVAALPMQQFMNQSAISIKYTMKVDNPADFLLLPESRELGYPYLPLKSGGTSDQISTTTIMLHNNKFSEINDSLRYGDWLNE